MSENNPKKDFLPLTTNQRRALEALLSGASKEQAAAAAGVRVRQLNRYLEAPNFRAALDKATAAAVGAVARRMVGGMETAVFIMLALAEDEAQPSSVRLRACIAIIEHGPRLFEQVELIRRLEVLEGRLL